MLAGCASNTPQAAGEPADRIDCALGTADFARTCAIERQPAVLILRHPDGGFRRLDVAPDRTLTAADGAGEVVGKPLPDGRLEIALGGDRYRLPQ